MKKVSVIVPVYNAENYLANCLETLIKQTYENIELLIINDGSTDNSLEICTAYEQKDDRIKLFNIPNSGVSTARNLGIDKSTGDYITFVDSDDWVELNAIEFGVNKMSETDADIIIWSYFKNFPGEERALSLLPGGSKTYTENKDLLYLKSIYQFYGQQTLGDTVSAGTTWGKFYKAELIKENDIKFKKELTRSQDVIFGLEAFSQAKVIDYHDVPLYHYRINNSSTCSGTRFINDTETPFNSLLNEMDKFSQQFKERENFEEAINARVVQVILWHLEHKYFHKNYNGNLLKRRKDISKLIERQPYSNALKNVNKKLLPKKEKLASTLFRRNLILTYYIIYNIHKKWFSKNDKFD